MPLRNEAGRIGETLPGLLAAGFDRVTLLDDESDDGTAAVVRELLPQSSAAIRRASGCSPGGPDHRGGSGRPGRAPSSRTPPAADVLVFCDADVHLAPGAAASIAAEMKRQGAEAFSVFPRQRTGGWAERLLVPLIDDVVLCFLPFGLLRAPVPQAAVAHGALFAFTPRGLPARSAASPRSAATSSKTSPWRTTSAAPAGGSGWPWAATWCRCGCTATAGEVVAGLGKRPRAGGRRAPVAGRRGLGVAPDSCTPCRCSSPPDMARAAGGWPPRSASSSGSSSRRRRAAGTGQRLV